MLNATSCRQTCKHLIRCHCQEVGSHDVNQAAITRRLQWVLYMHNVSVFVFVVLHLR